MEQNTIDKDLTVSVIKHKEEGEGDHQDNHPDKTDQKSEQSGYDLKQEYTQQLRTLKQQLLEKQNTIDKLQDSITKNKLELLNRRNSTNILQKQEPVNNRSSLSKYFSKSGEGNTNKEKILKQKIKETRNEIESVKKQLASLQKMKVSEVGTMKLMEQIQKLSNKKSQFKKIENERDILLKETINIEKDVEDAELKEITDKMTIQKNQHVELTTAIRQEKLHLQNLEKEDRYLTEKIQFFINSINRREGISKLKTEAAREISVEMKGLTKQMKSLLEEKDGVDNETKKTLDQLKSSIKSTENENWMLVNKLREYDSYLLKHYTQQTKKKNSVVYYNSVQEIPELETSLKEIKITEPSKKAETVAKKKKLVQVCYEEENLMKLSDYQLKPDRILSIQLYSANQVLIGICCNYSGAFGVEMGYKMCMFPMPRDTQKKVVLQFKQGQQIQEFKVGFSQDNEIVFFSVKTNNNETLRWGNDNVKQMESRSIQTYNKIWLIGSLGYPKKRTNPNQMVLKGIGFQIITISESC